jgi:IS4 transposase
VLGFGVRHERTLADLRRLYEEESKEHIGRSSFYDRFTPELVKFLYTCLLHGLESLAQNAACKLKEKLSGFIDLLIQDSTIIRLHEKLAKLWPAVRTRTVAAGVKLSLLVSAVANGPKNVALYAERTAELKTLRIGKWVKDRILLIDLGFFKHHLFARIAENGGYFVSRLKSKVDPLIVGINRICRGRAIDVVGKRLSEVLPYIKRRVLDAEVEIEFKRRKYKGKQKRDKKRLRLVAIYNAEEKKYHAYLTNISVTALDADDIGILYSARWQIELIFKELKSKYGIDCLPSANPIIVRALVWVAVLMLIVSRRVHFLVISSNPENAHRYPILRWAGIFAKKAHRILDAVLDYVGLGNGTMDLLEMLRRQTLDPNVNRKKLTDVWRA